MNIRLYYYFLFVYYIDERVCNWFSDRIDIHNVQQCDHVWHL